MFTKISPQHAADEVKGVSLIATSPYSFLYTDNEYTAIISSEPLKYNNREYAVCLYLSDLTEWDTPSKRPINDNDLEMIAKNIEAALHVLGMEVEIE